MDAGASRTRVLLLGPDGEPAARREGGPAALRPGAADAAAAAVDALVRDAAREAGLRLPLAAAVCGLAGAGRAADARAAEASLEARGLARRVRVLPDAAVAHRDAFGSGPGILVVAGTGAVAWGRGPGGAQARAGGWGPLLDDEGGGHDLARRGLRAALRAADGRGPETALRDALFQGLDADEADALATRLAGAGRAEVAALAPRVIAAAEAGDPVARRLVAEGAASLAAAARAVARSLGPWHRGPPVALAGGLVDGGGAYRNAIVESLAGFGLTVRETAVDGVRGAARMAGELAGG